MPLVVKDRVRETSTTAGTGTFTLAGAVLGYQSFSAIGDGNTTYYTIYLQGGNEWEVGIGTYTASGTTLSRDTILASSNAGSAVNFSAGTKDVFVTYPAGRSVWYDSATNVTLNALTLSGGTQNGVLYLNASRVATSGSALTFDGTKLGINGGVISDNNLVAQINTPASSAKFMAFNRSGDYGLIIGYEQSAGDYASIRTVFDYPIVFSVNNAEQMRLTSTGLALRQAGIPANTSVSLNTTIQNALTLEADGDLLVGTTTNTNSSKLVASGTISETVSSTQYLVASQFDIGTAANEIPLNQYLGNLAYQDAGSIAGPVGLGGAVTLSSGTANGVAYLNGSKVLTTGSALTFDGTNLLSTGGITSSGGDITVATAGKFVYSNYVSQNSGSSLYLRGATASGQIEFQTNTTTKATLDSSGNLGLGVTPSAWGSGRTAIQVYGSSTAAYFAGGTFNTYFSTNYYFNSGDKFIGATNYASYYTQSYLGQHQWWTSSAASSGADSTATMSQLMTLDSLGRLGVGATNPDSMVEINSATAAYARFKINYNSSALAYFGSYSGIVGSGNATDTMLSSQAVLAFGAGGTTERARITADGNFLVGTTDNTTGNKIVTSTTIGFVAGATIPQINYYSSASTIEYVNRDSGGSKTFSWYYQASAAGSPATLSTSGVWTNASDARGKENISDIHYGLDTVLALQPRQYDVKSDGSHAIGFVAQEVLPVVPELVHVTRRTESDEFYGLDYGSMTAVLVKAIQEQQAMINELKAEVAALKGA